MKKSAQKSTFIFAVILLIVVCFQNCAPSGLNSAASTAASTANPSASAAFISGLLVDSICQKLAACSSGLDANVCKDQVNALQGLPLKFGVGIGSALTMVDVANLERNRTLIGSGAFALDCTTALQALACSDAGVVGAYDHTTGSYAGVPQLIGEIASCGQVY